METKSQIRKQVLALRDTLTPVLRTRSGVLITERILGHQWYYKAEELLLFVSYGSEINTMEIMKDAFRQKKTVYVPKVEGDVIEFYSITSRDDLKEGFKGILEPESDKKKRFNYNEEKTDHVLMIMPGVAFDPVRNRIGYGKGYYDKYLSDKNNLHTIGIGFDCQMVSAIKTEQTDIKPMQVICL